MLVTWQVTIFCSTTPRRPHYYDCGCWTTTWTLLALSQRPPQCFNQAKVHWNAPPSLGIQTLKCQHLFQNFWVKWPVSIGKESIMFVGCFAILLSGLLDIVIFISDSCICNENLSSFDSYVTVQWHLGACGWNWSAYTAMKNIKINPYKWCGKYKGKRK